MTPSSQPDRQPGTDTILGRLDRLADRTDRGLTLYDGRNRLQRDSWAEVRRTAASAAAELHALGVAPGDRVAVVAAEPWGFAVALLATMWSGATPVSCAPPTTIRATATWAAEFGGLVDAAGVRLVLCEDAILPLVAEAPLPDRCLGAVDIAELTSGPPLDTLPSPPQPSGSDPAFIQFSSGSTRRPKGIVVTHRSLAANLTALSAALAYEPEADRIASWLPLYHDMGLIGGLLIAVWNGLDVTLSSPIGFLRDPLSWLDTVSRQRSTATVAPNFAMAVVANRLAQLDPPPEWDLSCIRILMCGAEPINAAVVERFLASLEPFGFDRAGFRSSYGAAEATLAMTTVGHGGYRVDAVNASALERGDAVVTSAGDAGARTVVSCGVPIPGHDVRVVDPDGSRVPERRVGEVVFSGPSLAAGYLDDPEATADAFRADGLHTGDLGYVAEGHLFVTGRAKDLIIVNGRNLDPSSIEWLVETVDGVRKGNVAAFSVPGEATEAVVVAAETRGDSGDLAARISRLVNAELGVPVDDVVLLAPGELPKTTSGKVQRSRARQDYLSSRR